MRLHARDFLIGEMAMLRKRKEPKRRSSAMTLMRDIQGTAAEGTRAGEVRGVGDDVVY